MAQKLTPRKRRAIAALLSSRNVQEAALTANVGVRSLYRWLAEDAFRAALLEAESQAIEEATRRLIGLQGLAIDAFSKTLEDATAGHALKIRAGQAIIENMVQLAELRDLEARLATLERIIGKLRGDEL